MLITMPLLLLLGGAEPVAATTSTRVLLPISSQPVAGVNQSYWTNEVWAYNPTTCPVVVRPTFADIDVPLPSHAAIQLPVPQMPAFRPPGLFVEILEPCPSSGIFLRLTVREEHSQTTTEFPIVYASEFSGETLHLLNVRSQAEERVHLRVYGDPLAGRHPQDVLVRIFDQESNLLLNEVILPLFDSVPPVAHYGEIPNLQLLLPPVAGNIRLEISPLDPASRIWSFLTTTNRMNHVAITSPQNLGKKE
jgi:hypothetical protein